MPQKRQKKEQKQSVSARGKNAIKIHEGLRLIAYDDVAGHRTIGWGHLMADTETYTHITREQADALFTEDLAEAEDIVRRNVHVWLDQGQFDALVSFVFNIGETKFRSSTLLRVLNDGKYGEAADQFKRWVFAGGRRHEGLARRRAAERNLFLGLTDGTK